MGRVSTRPAPERENYAIEHTDVGCRHVSPLNSILSPQVPFAAVHELPPQARNGTSLAGVVMICLL
jgi:hypothetical protein